MNKIRTFVLSCIVIGLILSGIPMPSARADSTLEKDMVFFLHYENETAKSLPGGGSTLTYFDTTTDWSEENVTIVVNAADVYFDWYLVPALAGDFTVSRCAFKIWARFVSGAAPNGLVEMTVYEVNETGVVWSEVFYQATNQFSVTPELKSFEGNLSEPHTFRAGSSIRFRFRFNPGVGKTFEFYYDTAQMNSRVVLTGSPSIAVQDVITMDHQRSPRAGFLPEVANKTMYIQANVANPFGGYDIKWVNLTIEDAFGTKLLDNVSMPKISGTPLDYISTYEIMWNYSGLDPGRYNITVWALDNNGYNYYTHFQQYTYGVYPDTYRSHFIIGEDVFVNLMAIDSRGDIMEGVTIVATVHGGLVDWKDTNVDGLVNMSLSTGAYRFQAFLEDVMVAEEEVDITGNVLETDPIVMECAVYYPDIRTVDSHEEPLENAAVYIVHPNGSSYPQPLRTNDTGHTSLHRVPGGIYSITVRWRGSSVATESIVVSSNGEYTISCAVYYASLIAIDSKGEAVPNAQLAVYDNQTGIVMDFKSTDSNGSAVSRLPEGIYDIEAHWKGILVHSSWGIAMSGDMNKNLDCDIYYLTVKTVDAKNRPLEGVLISITMESDFTMAAGHTSDAGEMIARLPKGEYTIDAHYRTTHYLSHFASSIQTITTLQESSTETIVFESYPPPMYTTNAFFISLAVLIAIILVFFTARKMAEKNTRFFNQPNSTNNSPQEEYSGEKSEETEMGPRE